MRSYRHQRINTYADNPSQLIYTTNGITSFAPPFPPPAVSTSSSSSSSAPTSPLALLSLFFLRRASNYAYTRVDSISLSTELLLGKRRSSALDLRLRSARARSFRCMRCPCLLELRACVCCRAFRSLVGWTGIRRVQVESTTAAAIVPLLSPLRAQSAAAAQRSRAEEGRTAPLQPPPPAAWPLVHTAKHTSANNAQCKPIRRACSREKRETAATTRTTTKDPQPQRRRRPHLPPPSRAPCAPFDLRPSTQNRWPRTLDAPLACVASAVRAARACCRCCSHI